MRNLLNMWCIEKIYYRMQRFWSRRPTEGSYGPIRVSLWQWALEFKARPGPRHSRSDHNKVVCVSRGEITVGFGKLAKLFGLADTHAHTHTHTYARTHTHTHTHTHTESNTAMAGHYHEEKNETVACPYNLRLCSTITPEPSAEVMWTYRDINKFFPWRKNIAKLIQSVYNFCLGHILHVSSSVSTTPRLVIFFWFF